MITPAIAGPSIRAHWTITLLSATALTTRSAPTISKTKLWRVGLSTELTVPRTKASATTIQASTSAVDREGEQRERRNRHRDLGRHQQPALVEAVGEHAGLGAEQQDRRELGGDVRPTATPLPVSCSTSHVSATICIQLPLSEITCPAK